MQQIGVSEILATNYKQKQGVYYNINHDKKFIFAGTLSEFDRQAATAQGFKIYDSPDVHRQSAWTEGNLFIAITCMRPSEVAYRKIFQEAVIAVLGEDTTISNNDIIYKDRKISGGTVIREGLLDHHRVFMAFALNITTPEDIIFEVCPDSKRQRGGHIALRDYGWTAETFKDAIEKELRARLTELYEEESCTK